ncbi:A/G-specific adenine glycosylase [Pelistega sp. MC2]|uniref:A/G-specific adenine glycosylase n=1 Tax=Pelistega sp. MC2 TaxID=1720297 RepID=UPI0008DA5D71|nr:A/G-specific adenine glycosylase [Pelistega sp. MC2]
MPSFVQKIQAWQQQSGRHNLPWQGTKDPYRVWLSEIMLQQTQVTTVIDYYQRFLQRFPTIADLAMASQEEVMPYWAGLGYYARARNLHHCAVTIWQDYQGEFPHSPDELIKLKGIGQSTANSIAAFCFDAKTPIMDGNVKRVFGRYYGITGYGSAIDKQLWEQAYKNVINETNIGQYNQGLMDLGSLICTRTQAKCSQCPVQKDCFAAKHNMQNSLPTKKPKKTLPTKETYLLIFKAHHHVLLQQRPQQGIWGGLLSLPEQESLSAVNSYLSKHSFGQTTEKHSSTQLLASFEHVFSHYRLIIHPVMITAQRNTLQDSIFIEDTQWYDIHPENLDKLALPRPIHNLLSGLSLLDTDSTTSTQMCLPTKS